MNKFFKYTFIALLGVLTLGLSSCTDEYEYTPTSKTELGGNAFLVSEGSIAVGAGGVPSVHIVVDGGEAHAGGHENAVLKFDAAGSGEDGRVVEKYPFSELDPIAKIAQEWGENAHVAQVLAEQLFQIGHIAGVIRQHGVGLGTQGAGADHLLAGLLEVGLASVGGAALIHRAVNGSFFFRSMPPASPRPGRPRCRGWPGPALPRHRGPLPECPAQCGRDRCPRGCRRGE